MTNKIKNHEFLSQLIGLCFPHEAQDLVIFTPDIPYILQENYEPEYHCRLYITPQHYTLTGKSDILSETPFGFFKPEIEQRICSPEENPYSSKFWEQILYLPSVSIYCLKEEYLNY